MFSNRGHSVPIKTLIHVQSSWKESAATAPFVVTPMWFVSTSILQSLTRKNHENVINRFRSLCPLTANCTGFTWAFSRVSVQFTSFIKLFSYPKSWEFYADWFNSFGSGYLRKHLPCGHIGYHPLGTIYGWGQISSRGHLPSGCSDIMELLSMSWDLSPSNWPSRVKLFLLVFPP